MPLNSPFPARPLPSRRARTFASGAVLTIALSLMLQPIRVRAQEVKAAPPLNSAALRESFQHPPADARIMMRWWWFGAAVTKPELERELKAMKQGGIGGVEIQPVYPLALDDSAQGIRNLPYLSDEFLDALHFANETARSLGMRVDLTLASGWPFGGSYVTVAHSAGSLRVVTTAIPDGASSVPTPNISNGEQLVATFLAKTQGNSVLADGIQRFADVNSQRIAVPAGTSGPHAFLFFVASHTGQQVKRAAAGADGFVLDHFSSEAVADHLQKVGDKLMHAFGSQPPYSVFSDSLEVYNSDWTSDLPQQFRQRRGYDIVPYLPMLMTNYAADASDQKTADIRHDWGQTLTELINERYLTQINTWAREHGTHFRSQSYGNPAVTLSSNALVDLPEGEGPQWRTFSYTRWATSASHLYGRPITSAETWTWLHSPAFRATPLDMKAEADLFFLQGVNQIIGHGWPYTPPSVAEPGWALYAAAVFNDHNPWWMVMPDVAAYLQRCSFMLRQGNPANDVALMLPEDDAWAHFSTGNNSITALMPKFLGPNVIPQILDAGFNLDYIDAAAIDSLGVAHPVLVLPGVERIPLATYRKIEAHAKQGGIVIATRSLPSRAPGLKAAESDSNEIRAISQRLFQGPTAAGHFIADDTQLGAALDKLTAPDMALAPATPEIGFIHRKLASIASSSDTDLYFIANTSNQPKQTHATFHSAGRSAEWWNPHTGKVTAIADTANIVLDLAPYESRILVFTNQRPKGIASHPKAAASVSIDISSGWSVSFTGLGRTVQMDQLRSWTSDESTRFFSGQAVYAKTIYVPAAMLNPGVAVNLDFGPGKPLDPPAAHANGTQALLESPVREAARVFINGKDAGSIWHPQFVLDVTSLLQAGSNEIRVVVANTAINTLAGRTLPDYRLLNARYGERFTPQDMKNLEPLPSGVLGSVRLVAVPAE